MLLKISFLLPHLSCNLNSADFTAPNNYNFSSSKTSWRRLGRRKIVTLNTCWRRLQDVFKANKCLLERFWVEIFYPRAFLTLRSFTDIFGTFLWLRCGQDHSTQDFFCACPHRVVPSGWRMDLNDLYCRYKTIDLSIAPVSHEV